MADGVLQEEHILWLSGCITGTMDLRRLATALGVPPEKVGAIEQDHSRSCEETAYGVITEYNKKQTSDEEAYRNLHAALGKCEMFRLQANLQEMVGQPPQLAPGPAPVPAPAPAAPAPSGGANSNSENIELTGLEIIKVARCMTPADVKKLATGYLGFSDAEQETQQEKHKPNVDLFKQDIIKTWSGRSLENTKGKLRWILTEAIKQKHISFDVREIEKCLGPET